MKRVVVMFPLVFVCLITGSPVGQSAQSAATAGTGAQAGRPVVSPGQSLYLLPPVGRGFYRVNTLRLKRALNKAGFLVAEERSEAKFFLSVWRDSHGFHGELSDSKRAVQWEGSTATQGGFVRGLARYVRNPSGALTTTKQQKTPKDLYSVRMGDLVVTVVALRMKAVAIQGYQADSQLPHRLLSVHVKIENVGKQFPCTSLDVSLDVRPFYEYRLDYANTKWPDIHDLLPGETIEADYAFNTRDGTEPVALVLKATDSQELRCVQHPDWSSIWHARSDAHLPLDGLPTTSEKARTWPPPTPPDNLPGGQDN